MFSLSLTLSVSIWLSYPLSLTLFFFDCFKFVNKFSGLKCQIFLFHLFGNNISIFIFQLLLKAADCLKYFVIVVVVVASKCCNSNLSVFVFFFFCRCCTPFYLRWKTTLIASNQAKSHLNKYTSNERERERDPQAQTQANNNVCSCYVFNL